MKKKILLILGVVLTAISVNAQDYYQGVGGQINYGVFRTKTGGEVTSVEAAAVPGIFYKASLAFEINRKTNFAISAYPFLGLSGSFNSSSGVSSGASIGAELPILGEIYFGDLDDPCFFVGGGFSAAFLGSAGFGAGAIVGPSFDLGGQFNLRDRLLGVRVAYTYGVNGRGNNTELVKNGRSMFTFGAYYLLGQ